MTAYDEVLIVGAGFAGATIARVLADAGHRCRVIDRRPHIGGNAFDEMVDGVRIHRYGPHLFHTSNDAVVKFLSRFTEWSPYEHRVVAELPNKTLVPLPVNLTTLEIVSGQEIPDEAAAQSYLRKVSVPFPNPRNAEEFLYANIGEDLTNLFFRPYSEKMWSLRLAEIDTSVVKRIPLRFNRDDRYFPNDTFQALPSQGYTKIFVNMLDHPGISVETNVAYEKGMNRKFTHVYNAMPIDEFFGFSYGHLPYRSIKFHTKPTLRDDYRGHVTVNYTDSAPRTRFTQWHNLPAQADDCGCFTTYEEPCSYEENDLERYYPVKDATGTYRDLYLKYAALANANKEMTFVGRCGTYQYLDMDQVVNQQLQLMKKRGFYA